MQLTGSAYRHRSHAARQYNCVRALVLSGINIIELYIFQYFSYSISISTEYVIRFFASTRFHFVV